MLKDPESSLNPPFTSEGHSYFTDKKPEGDNDKSGGKQGSQASLKPNSYRDSPFVSFFFGPDASLASKSFAILAYIMLCDPDSDPYMWFILYLEVLIGRLLV